MLDNGKSIQQLINDWISVSSQIEMILMQITRRLKRQTSRFDTASENMTIYVTGSKIVQSKDYRMVVSGRPALAG